ACYSGTQATGGVDGYFTPMGDAYEMSSQHASRTTPNIYNRIHRRGAMRPESGGPFADWNPINLHKTTVDRMIGNRTNSVVRGTDTVNLYFHGSKMVQAIVSDLNRSRGAITVDGVTLTKLSEATDVVLIGNSGGAGGVIMLAERFKGWVQAIAPS